MDMANDLLTNFIMSENSIKIHPQKGTEWRRLHPTKRLGEESSPSKGEWVSDVVKDE